MARVEIAPAVVEDLDRIFDHLARHEADHVSQRIGEIVDALSVLETNPLIGRPTTRSKRELVIGQHSRGYVALYRYVPQIGIVFVLAIRGQREAGYAKG